MEDDPDIAERLRSVLHDDRSVELMNREAADEIERLQNERDEARQRTNSIITEIDCRIEHGAESNGHLEGIRNLFKNKK